ncbi:hypothetical protein NUU61_008646 [Penicillium alfredii]|uniref:Fructose-bisphosphate aldolase n=1 Tax=Penicillium alfredii TaxID=1506179 RepID=A0A9W9ELL3_9EURO|nr:uncharacterized protein NUU61_008646 [Penicillium alfredii]KAJ5084067.1 hypothetical protein NUU61_008646 [Penicillium alfredii]
MARTADMSRPEEAEVFVRRSGVHFLAPSFGNIHGGYPSEGAERRLGIYLDHPISLGVRKINLNRTVRDEYSEFVAKNAGVLELTALKVQAVEVYARSMERMDVLGSSGRY